MSRHRPRHPSSPTRKCSTRRKTARSAISGCCRPTTPSSMQAGRSPSSQPMASRKIELNTVLHYFRSRGAQVDLIAPKKPSYPDFLGLQIPAVRETHIMTITFIANGGWIRFDRNLEGASRQDYDVVIVPARCWYAGSV